MPCVFEQAAGVLQRLFRGHVQRSELAGHRRAATMVQAYIRRCQAILNTRETRQKLAKENGVLVACKGTIQGHSGWYHQEEDGEKYYFTVENDTVCDPLITDERCWKRLLISSMSRILGALCVDRWNAKLG